MGKTRNNIDKTKYKRENKIVVFFLTISFGIVLIIFWTLVKNVNGPVDRLLKQNQEKLAKVQLNTPDFDFSDNKDLKKKDTDNDGLNDYKELYIYKTSPYLKDTDSDGLSDYDEIQKSQNPNCPVGEKCNNYYAGQALAGGGNVDDSKTQMDSELYNISELHNLNQQRLPVFTDAEQLRVFLKEYGMDEELLKNIPDEKLMQVYKEQLKNLNKKYQ
jgi:hypothetical protein